jgi:uncharacterized repeat protein (TIGR03803 family)
MKSRRSSIFTRVWSLWIIGAAVFGAAVSSSAADLVIVEAESGTLGTNFLVTSSGGVTYISNTNNNGTTNPGIPGRVASYTVNFPAAGTYDLFARVRVGPGSANDDSFFYGNSFGNLTVNSDADWILVNSINAGGFTNSSDIVAGSGSAGIQVWKWINFSQYTGTAGETPITFTVNSGGLTQTFQIGGREDGLDIDKLAFGTSGAGFTVSNLDNGTIPSNPFAGPDGIAFHRFSPLNNGVNADGANPVAGLVFSGGVFCGTTLNGGLQAAGTAFYLSPDGTSTVAFRSFTNSSPDAANPHGDLAVSGNIFFGTTFGGGASGVGTVFVGQTNGNVSVLRSFTSVSAHTATNSGGASPTALIALSSSTLYGTTTAGGTAANGTIFSLTTNAATFSVLHNFGLLDSKTGTNVDGAAPWGGLILAGDTLYGTASAGGAGGMGTVFSVKTNGSNFNTLYNFSAPDPITSTNNDGAIPYGGLVLQNGILFGTTIAGGFGNSGVIFALSTNGSGFTVLHHFAAVDATTRTNTDGAKPVANLIAAGKTLFGTASAGGAGGGTVFSIGTDGARFKIIYSFSAVDSDTGTNAYGAYPVSGLSLVGTSLYGTASGGGPGASGTVFSLAVPIVPAAITSIGNNPDGSVTLFFEGTPNSTNVIQSTFALGPSAFWQNVSTNTANSGGFWQFTDPAAGIFAAQFYRSFTR